VNEVFQAIALVLTAIVGTAVVLTRDPLRQALMLGMHGMALVITFVALQAPDVALSAIVISTIGLPPMVLLALRKIRQFDEGDE
jgi:energy-converting hydrogenase B subunit D